MSMSSVGPLPAGRARRELVAEVRTNLRHLPDGVAVVVACSGGPDSSALAHLAADARPDLQLVLVHAAHGLRPREAELADRAVVHTHASWLGAEVVGCDLEVTAAGRGVEAAARDARYRALRSVARSRAARGILVGHSADDQAETVLLRLARGTGIDGVVAMSVVSGDLTRPLLRLRRADLRAFALGEGLPVATDETNEDPQIRRVRVRGEVLPALARIGPDPVATLARFADLARDDVDALEAAAAAVPDATRRIGPVVALRIEALRTVPVAIARRVVRRAIAHLLDTPPSAATVARVLDARVGDAATLPGGVAFRAEHTWRTLVHHDADPPADAVALPTPGSTVWVPAGLSLRTLTPAAGPGTAEPATGPTVQQISFELPGAWVPPRHRVRAARAAPGTEVDRYSVALPAAVGPLEVRAPAPGDRIRGPGGSRRVVDVLRDAGMPRAVRARWALVCETGEIARVVWIPGVAVDAGLAASGRRDPAIALHATPT